jgi:SpoVK/Ycf46/Vps4 family AAA+-type ATPase
MAYPTRPVSALVLTTKRRADTIVRTVTAERPVFYVDMSTVVSQYIGETEKNLAALFKAAQDGMAILFFDEADALFGKRTPVKDSHDRYANLEVSYLVQRAKSSDGLVVLGTNLRTNIDSASLRGFDPIVRFPFRTAIARTILKQSALDTQHHALSLPSTRHLPASLNIRR